MAVLRVKTGNEKGKVFELTEDNLVIGREEAGGVQILDQGVSRKHAEVFRIGELFFIRDLESRNGTFVNEEKVMDVVLRFGDRIRIGNTVLVFEDRLARYQDSAEILGEEAGAAAQAPTPSSTLQIRLTDTFLHGPPRTPVKETPESRRLSALVGISHIIGSERDLSKVLTQGAVLLGKVIDADNVFIFNLRGGKEGGDDFELLARHDRSEDARKESVSRSIIRDCLEKGHAVLTADAGLDARFHAMASVVMKQIKSVICVPITGLGKNIGVLYLSNAHRSEAFTAEDLELASAVAAQFGTTIQLLQMIHRSERIFRNSIRTLVKAIEMRDPLNLGRAERLAASCLATARELGWSTPECRNAWLSGMLYDIGSIPLTDKEMQAQFTVETRKNHYAGELLKEMPGLEEILPAIVQYRERWDGSGSPEGKKGREIHPLAQVLGLAYEFDELLLHGGTNFTNLSEKEALIKIMETAGKKFDPDTVKAFLVAYRKGKVHHKEAAFFEAP